MRASAEPRVLERAPGAAGSSVRFADELGDGDRADVVAVLASCDPTLLRHEQVTITVLVGGANNRNYVVEANDHKYVLRIASHLNARLAVDRASAIRAQQDAAEADLAPAVVAYKLPEGHVLSTFLEGKILDSEQLRDVDVLHLVGRTLRRLHGLQTTSRTFSPFADIDQWARQAREDGTELPRDLDALLALIWRIKSTTDGLDLPTVFCHNDTVPQNFIRRDSELRLVDWDYAGRGFACFELASFCATADLPWELQEVVLRAYDNQVTDSQRARVRLLRYVAVMRETTWALMARPLLKGTTTPAGADFYENYVERHLRIARRMIAEPELAPWLNAAASSPRGEGW